MPSVAHSTNRYENNRAEVSHQPTRQREQQMRQFKSPGQAQRFLSVHGVVVGLAFAMLLRQASRDVLRRDSSQDAVRRRGRGSTRGKLWHRASDGPIRKVFAVSHHNLLSRSEWWLEVDLGKQKTMRMPHRIEFDAHKRGAAARASSHPTAGTPACDHRWAGVSLSGTHWPTDCRLVRDRVAAGKDRGTR